MNQNSESEGLKSKFESYKQDKNTTAAMIKEYLNTSNPTARALIDALKLFSESQKESSAKTQDLLKQTLTILESELNRDLSEERRNRIYDLIILIIQESRKESDENRSFYKDLALIGAGAAIMVVGVGVLIVTKGKYKDIFVKGMQLMRLK